MSVPSLMSGAPDGVKSRSVYRLSSSKMRRMYFVLAVSLISLVFFIWFPLSKQDRVWAADFLPAMVLTGFILFDIFAGLFLASLRTRLITSPWGIEYYSILDGIKLRAPWKSVIGVENLRYFNEWADFLVTSEPAEKSGFLVASMAMFKAQHPGASSMDMDKIRRSIPIAFFVDDWRYSTLGDEIRRYAPQVFSEEEEREASSRASTAGTRGATSDEAASAFTPTGREEKKRRRLRSMLVALAVILCEVIFSFFVAPSIYRSIHPVDSNRSSQPVNGSLVPRPTLPERRIGTDGSKQR